MQPSQRRRARQTRRIPCPSPRVGRECRGKWSGSATKAAQARIGDNRGRDVSLARREQRVCRCRGVPNERAGRQEGLRGTRGQKTRPCGVQWGIRGRASVWVIDICTGRDKEGQIGCASGWRNKRGSGAEESRPERTSQHDNHTVPQSAHTPVAGRGSVQVAHSSPVLWARQAPSPSCPRALCQPICG